MRRSLQTIVLLFCWLLAGAPAAEPLPKIEVDPETLAAAGIRKLNGEYVTIYTDLTSGPEIDILPRVFDRAVPEWARFFEAKLDVFDGWHVDACIIQNKQRFRDYGLLPDDLPPFLNGLQMFDRVWVYEQPSPYYRRHLLLHEGTHAAMNRIFGHVGPAWYREGIAEFLGTHRLVDGKPELGYFPAGKEEVKHWGRIKIIKDELAGSNLRSVSAIVGFHSREFLNVESYAWTWAIQTFGQRHPQFAPIFHELADSMHTSPRAVTRRFLARYHERQHEIDMAWYAFLRHLEYGYDSRSESVVHNATAAELGEGVLTFKIDSARGWQSTGLKLPPDTEIDIGSRTRFQIASELAENRPGGTRPWISEPQGVTIEYYRGRPLGMLLAAVVDPKRPQSGSAVANPVAIGRLGQLKTVHGGTLFLRINERTDRMSDNRGEITVSVRRRVKPTN